MHSLKTRWAVVITTAFAILISVSNAQNAPTSVGPIQLAIPEGFEFASSGQKESMTVSAWTKAAGSSKTLLQVSIVDMGSPADSATPAELARGSEIYLRQFLSGVQGRRTDYLLSPVRHLTIAGLPAASAKWTGKLAGLPIVGVMYCVIVHARYIISFHTQDLGDTPTPAMRQAMKSFESASVRPL